MVKCRNIQMIYLILNPIMTTTIYTINKVAEKLKVNRRTIEIWIKKGKIPFIQTKGKKNKYYIDAKQLDEITKVHSPKVKNCEICGDEIIARGLCNKHYLQFYRTKKIILSSDID